MTVASLKLDHVLCYTAAATVEARLEHYRAAGFLPHERTVRHHPGLRNGFVTLGPEYLELLWVEDEAAFAAAGPWRQAQRRALRPFAVAVASPDVHELRAALLAAGHAVPAVRQGAPRGAAGPPPWSFLDLPPSLGLGVACFALTYHDAPARARHTVRVAENGVYALSGLTFVTPAPLERAARWREVLGAGGGGDTALLGPHHLTWRTPADHHARCGRAAGAAPTGLALVHLHSVDLARTATRLAAAGRGTVRAGDTLLVAPDGGDGFALAIDERPPSAWLAGRRAATGEPLEVAA